LENSRNDVEEKSQECDGDCDSTFHFETGGTQLNQKDASNEDKYYSMTIGT
jgi:hypothetical protein